MKRRILIGKLSHRKLKTNYLRIFDIEKGLCIGYILLDIILNMKKYVYFFTKVITYVNYLLD